MLTQSHDDGVTITLEKMHDHETILAAQRIIGEFVELRDRIKSVAEGFAILDFVQGHVATDLPAATARDIVDVMRNEESAQSSGYSNDLALFWLENYRRAYSHMVMRVLEDGADSMAV
jgi:hypothetical protein